MNCAVVVCYTDVLWTPLELYCIIATQWPNKTTHTMCYSNENLYTVAEALIAEVEGCVAQGWILSSTKRNA